MKKVRLEYRNIEFFGLQIFHVLSHHTDPSDLFQFDDSDKLKLVFKKYAGQRSLLIF